MPRVRPDGTANPFLLQRLKDKLGNRSNASGRGGVRRHVGLAGRGPRDAGWSAILDMVTMTRLDCVIGSAATQARGADAGDAPRPVPHGRSGRRCGDQPLMREVLADLALESEAATALFLRLAAGA